MKIDFYKGHETSPVETRFRVGGLDLTKFKNGTYYFGDSADTMSEHLVDGFIDLGLYKMAEKLVGSKEEVETTKSLRVKELFLVNLKKLSKIIYDETQAMYKTWTENDENGVEEV